IHQAGAMNLTGTNNSSAGALVGMDLTGTINGDVVIDDGGSLNIAGAGARGILLTGNLDTCDLGVTPDCVGTGALINNGIISTRGGGTGSNATGNPIASSAIGIGGSVAGGIFNAGPTFDGEKIGAAAISTQGAAPALSISTSLEVRDIGEDPFAIDIGKYLGDA